MSGDYGYYNMYGGGYASKFIERNPEFDTPQFISYLSQHNRGDRDTGELQDVAKHEVLRVAAMYEEYRWRFPNIFGDPTE